jgi:hypothetical protein
LPVGPTAELLLELVPLVVGGGLGREFLLGLTQGFGFLGAEALQLGGDALLDLELEGLEAGDVGLELSRFGLEREADDGYRGESCLTSLLVSRDSTKLWETPAWGVLATG